MSPSIYTNIRRLLVELGRPNWKSYAFVFSCMAVGAAATGLTAYLMKDVINQVFIDKDETATYWIAAVVALVYAIKGATSFLQQLTLNKVGNTIVATTQIRLFDHLLRKGVPFFAASHSTSFLARQSFVSGATRGALDIVINSIGRDMLTLVSLVTVMLIQDPLMAAGAFVTLPLALIGVRYLIKRVKKIILTEFVSFSDIMQTASETALGIRVVKAFGLEAHLRAKMTKSVNDYARAATRLANVSGRASPLMETLGGFAIAFVIVYGGYRVIHNGQTPGEFFSFITALLLAYEPAKRLARFNIDLSANMVGVDMLYRFLDSPAEEREDGNQPDLVVGKGEIVFDAVDFAYRPEDPVLDKLSFVAAGGRVTALVGPSGSGKSTVFNLLQRFYTCEIGKISIDGQDIGKVNRASLRRAIAPVSQDTFLFQGSIRENIALGRPGASDGEIVAACKAAHVDDFVRDFADGYDAQVGEHGLALSGGQRQRVAIARAMLKNSPIVLLDEATSALDVASEEFVRDGLQRLCAGRTVLIIAHRKESYAHADNVIAIDSGRILQAVPDLAS